VQSAEPLPRAPFTPSSRPYGSTVKAAPQREVELSKAVRESLRMSAPSHTVERMFDAGRDGQPDGILPRVKLSVRVQEDHLRRLVTSDPVAGVAELIYERW
jgi:hypothetical protein